MRTCVMPRWLQKTNTLLKKYFVSQKWKLLLIKSFSDSDVIVGISLVMAKEMLHKRNHNLLFQIQFKWDCLTLSVKQLASPPLQRRGAWLLVQMNPQLEDDRYEWAGQHRWMGYHSFAQLPAPSDRDVGVCPSFMALYSSSGDSPQGRTPC